MKPILLQLILFLCLAVMTPSAKADWFDFGNEHKEKLVQVEHELAAQRQANDTWVAIAGTLAVGCVLLLIIGTALGAKVRRHHATKP